MIRYLPNKIISYQLYIFQLEEYELKRFLTSLFKKGLFPSSNLRKKVIWTTKARLITIIAIFLQLGFTLAISYLLNSLWFNTLISFVLLFLFIFYFFNITSFIFLIQAQDILRPIEIYQKNKIINQAKKKLNQLKNLKIIGITGSYGKTTMKEVLSEILGVKFRVVSTFENQNTPIGIARKILKDVDDSTEIFIVEMGEYVKGDVEKICRLTPPDISIITGINEAHLERYLTMENAISTKFEIVENMNQGGFVLLNADDELTLKNYKRFIKNNKIEWYSSSQSSLSNFRVESSELNTKQLGLNFTLKDLDFDREISFKTGFLAEYVIGNVVAGLIVGKFLGMNENEIKLGVSKIKPVEHRLEPSMLDSDIILIDDTYNGNSNGIKEGLKLLSKFSGRRKVYITPGLVETGDLTREIHLDIGKNLSEVADLVVLTRNSVTPFIEEGLIKSGFSKDKIIWFNSSKETYSNLRSFIKQGDVVLMQNDWSDNYS